VLLGFIAREPMSGYGLKRRFSASPAGLYQPSPGALYPALRRLVARGLLSVQDAVSRGRRELRLYHVTEAGRAAHLDWLREPVDPVSVVADLGLHLMRFAMMENQLERAEVLAFLAGLADALDGFVSGMERYVASGAQSGRRHAELALEHGIAVHRASLEWTRSAMAALAGPPAPDRSSPAAVRRSGPATARRAGPWRPAPVPAVTGGRPARPGRPGPRHAPPTPGNRHCRVPG
jgi:DNA-binding PadR family transcriptional regulator